MPGFPTLSPMRADDLPAGSLLQIGQQRHHFVGGPALVQRLDQRLHDRRRPVVALRIAPRLQVMRLGQVPVALVRGLIEEQAVVNAERDFLQVLRRSPDRPGRCKPGCRPGSPETRPAPAPCPRTSSRSDCVRSPGLASDGSRVGHGLAHVAKVLVEHVRQQMDDRRLAVSGQHQAAAAMCLEVLGHRGDPFLATDRPPGPRPPRRVRVATARASPSISRGPQCQPMVGLGAGATHGRFDHVQPVHPRRRGILRRGPHSPPCHEVGRVAEASRTALQEVGIQREHHVGLAEIVDRVDRLRRTPSGPRARPYRGGSARRRAILPRASPSSRASICSGERRRDDGFGQQAQPGAAAAGAASASASRMAASASPQVRVWPRWVTVWERSGS